MKGAPLSPPTLLSSSSGLSENRAVDAVGVGVEPEAGRDPWDKPEDDERERGAPEVCEAHDPVFRTDVFTPEQRSAVMRAVPARNSTPELKVRKLLTRLGARYRLHRRDLPGSPDIVFPSRRLALFVHGCFWHGHDCARGARAPKSNTAYWIAKIARNRARDAAADAALSGQDWRAEVVWECELKDEPALTTRLGLLLR